MLISNMGPGELGIKFGIKGPNYVTTSACASASHALGTAYSEMVLGRVRACISGGCEATVTPLGVAGFTALKALSTHFNDNPTMSSRPFDKDRDGLSLAKAAVCSCWSVLRTPRHAAPRYTRKSSATALPAMPTT